MVIADSQKCINSSTFEADNGIEKRPVFTWCWGRCVNLYQAIRVPSCHLHMWSAERKPGTSCKYWIRVRDDFICAGRFSAQLRLLHQGITAGLDFIILNYEARLCYYKDAISLNSQAGQWNTGTRCYGQLKHTFAKKVIYKLPVCIRLSFCL